MGTPEDVAAENYYTPPDELCPECQGQTVMFIGSGKNMQYKICPRYTEPGHKSEEEIIRMIGQVRLLINPSGRLA